MHPFADKRLLLGTAVAGLIALAILSVYRTQHVIDWPLTFGGAANVAQILALIIGGAWAYVRFGLTRASATFLQMALEARVIDGTGPTILVAIVVRLENRGDTRISARRSGRTGGMLYSDAWDHCEHAGTLKVRALPPETGTLAFDWYSLAPLSATLAVSAPGDVPPNVTRHVGDLEQVNYLTDFQDPVNQYAEVDFWLEPHEVYELSVPIWLPPGRYAMKAYLFGEETRHQEEEYWSNTSFFRLARSAA